MSHNTVAYADDVKCLNVGCENPAKSLWKCKQCYTRDRKAVGCGVQTPEQRKAYRESHREEIAAYTKQWEEDNREHRNTYQREQLRRNPELNRARYKAWAAQNPEKHRAQRLKSQFGISWEQYLQMWEDQQCKCGICSTELQKYGQQRDSVTVDHDHSITDRISVHALLCAHCNKGIGHFDDMPHKLIWAATYLVKHAKINNTLSDGDKELLQSALSQLSVLL